MPEHPKHTLSPEEHLLRLTESSPPAGGRPIQRLRDAGLPPYRAFWRLLQRVTDAEAWAAADLHRLAAAYRATPKLWWHLPRACRPQLTVYVHARQSQTLGRLSPALLDAVARCPDPEALAQVLSRALCTNGRTGARPWTSLEDVVCAVLRETRRRQRRSPDAGGTHVPAPIMLGPWARPLTSRAALQEEADQLGHCLSQSRWWRRTRLGQGLAYAIETPVARATLWLVPAPPPATAAIDRLMGPGNTPAPPGLREQIQAALDQHAAQNQDAAPCWSAVTNQDLYTLAHRSAARPHVRRPVRVAALPARTVGTLPPVHWLTAADLLGHTLHWSDGALYSEGVSEDAGAVQISWDPDTSTVWQSLPEGRFGLRFAPRLEVMMPPGAALPQALWMSIRARADRTPGPVQDVIHAVRQVLPDTHLHLADAAHVFTTFPGLWVLDQAPALIPTLQQVPLLGSPILRRLTERPDTLPGLQVADSCTAVLQWLGLPRPAAMAAVLHRLGGQAYTLDALHSLTKEWMQAGSLMHALPRIVPAQVMLLDRARRTGMSDRLTPELLSELRQSSWTMWHHESLGALFAELEAHAQTRAPPRFQSLAHLLEWVVRRQVHLPAQPPAPLALPGPWGALINDADELARRASSLHHSPTTWVHAWRSAGFLCAVGELAGGAVTTWLRPAGLRGELALQGALDQAGQPAAAAAIVSLRAGVRAHNARLLALPPGWGPAEAVAAGLSKDTGHITAAGRCRLDNLITLLDLCDD